MNAPDESIVDDRPSDEPASEDPRVLALVMAYQDAVDAGQRPDRAALLAAHPDLAAAIQEYLEALEIVRTAAPSLHLAPVPEPVAGARLGEYRILREVGRGGMGVVYEAVQEPLGRHVALKVLPRQGARTGVLRERFQCEARAASRLHHTNIVPVFGVGEDNGVLYYAMQFIPGRGLDAVLSEVRRQRDRASAAVGTACSPDSTDGKSSSQSPGESSSSAFTTVPAPGAAVPSGLAGAPEGQYFRTVAAIAAQAAEALEYAHQQGVLHRDIKPANLLLDDHGTVWVTDFGLARLEGADELTHTGEVVGTLRYMAPERLRGRADARSDVYSLGATLYELATLHPAHDCPDRLALMQQIEHDPPVLPNRLASSIPRDLETIILKAMDKEPARRYQSAAELADDLRRFLDDRAIRARPLGWLGRLQKWAKRRPTVAALATALIAAVVLLLVLGVWSYVGIRRALGESEEALGREERQRQEAEALAYRALLSETEALRLARRTGWRDRAVGNLRTLASMTTPERDPFRLRNEAVACLVEPDATEVARVKGKNSMFVSLDFSPDGKTVALSNVTGKVSLWEPATGDVREVPGTPRERPRPMLPAGGYAPGVRQTPGQPKVGGQSDPPPEVPAPPPQRPAPRGPAYGTGIPSGPGFRLRAVVRFHPDSSLASGTPDGAYWIRSGVVEPAPLPGDRTVVGLGGLAFDRRGSLLALSRGSGHVGVYEMPGGTLRREWTIPGRNPVEGNLVPVALSPDGDRLAAPGPDHAVHVHPVVGDKPPRQLGRHRDLVLALRFSPDGRLLASASADHTVKLWDLEAGQEHLVLVGHAAGVHSVAFSPDGGLLATAGADASARLWDTRTGRPLLVLPQVGETVSEVAFSADGAFLAVAGIEAVLYRLTVRHERRLLVGHAAPVRAVSFHPRRPLLASLAPGDDVLLWDLAGARPVRRWPGPDNRGGNASALAFSPDGLLLAAGPYTSQDGELPGKAVHLWETDTGKLHRRFALKSIRVQVGPKTTVISYGPGALSFDPAGKRLAVSREHHVDVIDIASGEAKPITIEMSRRITFLDSGRLLVQHSNIGVWDLATGRVDRWARLSGEERTASYSAWEPGSDCLALVATDGAVHLVGLPSLERRGTLAGRDAKVTAAALGAGGRWLATGGQDGNVLIRNTQTLQEILSLPPQNGPVRGLAFGGDAYLAVWGEDGTVTMYHLALVRKQLTELGLDW